MTGRKISGILHHYPPVGDPVFLRISASERVEYQAAYFRIFYKSLVCRRREMRYIMPEIEVKKNEPFESALRRFKRKIEQEGVLREVRDRKHYEKPSERKRKKRSRQRRY